jgi:hypothetical protein
LRCTASSVATRTMQSRSFWNRAKAAGKLHRSSRCWTWPANLLLSASVFKSPFGICISFRSSHNPRSTCREPQALTSIAKRGRRPLAGKRAHTRGAADCDCHRKLLAPLSAYRQNQIKAPNAAHSHAPAARKGLIILCPRQSQTKAEEAKPKQMIPVTISSPFARVAGISANKSSITAFRPVTKPSYGT